MASKKTKAQGWQDEVIKAADWLDESKLVLIAGWSRDGYTYKDIARKIGISISTFCRWRRKYPEFDEAMKEGREIVDYKVENALLKSALGYRTKESRITIIMRYGKVVEEQKETLTKEVAPNVTAIQTWLYNRLPEKWNRRNGNLADDLSEDESIKIEVTRAKVGSDNDTQVIEGSSGTEGTSVLDDSVNKSLTVRKAKKDEKKKAQVPEETDKTIVSADDWDVLDEKDEDYWPEDDEWEAMKAAKRGAKDESL